MYVEVWDVDILLRLCLTQNRSILVKECDNELAMLPILLMPFLAITTFAF